MPDVVWTRRAMLAAVAGAVASSPALAQQAAASRFGTVSVDVSRLARQGLASTAAAIHDDLLAAMRRTFADLMGGGPTLVARIDSFYLASYAGSEFGFRENSSNNDYLEGAGLVLGGGRVLSSTPILSALPASYSGAWYLPDIDARRIASITEHFAYWLRREMGS